MSEIKVGEYVRSKKGYIAKVTTVGHFLLHLDKTIDFEQDSGNYYSGIDCIDNEDLEKNILKHSPNIIDLIEVGDYVNGCEVMNIYIPNDVWDCIEIEINDKNRRCFLTCEIKSIVTREQFLESEYKVNE